MASLSDLIKRKLKLVDSVFDVFRGKIDKTEERILRDVLKELKKFSRKSGKLSSGKTDTQLLIEIREAITKVIEKSPYISQVEKYVLNFDKIEDLTRQIVESQNNIKTGKVKTNAEKSQAIKEVTKALIAPTALDTNVAEPIVKIMFQHVTLGSSVNDAETALKQFIAGDAKRNGYLTRYVTQISRDSVQNFGGVVNAKIAAEFELDCLRYVGGLVKDSRPQCVRWVKKEVLRQSELPAEIAWATANGTGFRPGVTTPATFPIFRGGWNCRHEAIPFRCDD